MPLTDTHWEKKYNKTRLWRTGSERQLTFLLGEQRQQRWEKSNVDMTPEKDVKCSSKQFKTKLKGTAALAWEERLAGEKWCSGAFIIHWHWGSGSVCFGTPGSGFGSISQRYGSGSFYHQAKRVRKTMIPTVLWLLYDFLSLKNDINVFSKNNKQKNFKYVSFLNVSDEKSRIRIRIH